MAIDNLNYYSSWLPAWQQTDKYSSQPWCLKSKNLDIFSSSKSVKATAWSEPTQADSDVIKQDWKLILKTDWKVYERESGVDTLFVDPSVNFPSYDVSYNGSGWAYTPATRWTVKDMVVAYEWDEWRSFVVYTDRASYTYSKVPYIAEKELTDIQNLTFDSSSPYVEGYKFTKSDTTSSSAYIDIKMPWVQMTDVPIKIWGDQEDASDTDITLDEIKWYKQEYYYDPSQEQMVAKRVSWELLPLPQDDIKSWPVEITIPAAPSEGDRILHIKFYFTTKAWRSSSAWDWDLYIDMNKPWSWHRLAGYEDGDYNGYYSYLPIDDNRHLVDIWEYQWMPSRNFQVLYTWDGSWAEIANWELVTRYDFVQYMWWANDPAMDIVAMMAWNEQIYMIGNMNWNWYVIPCDLTWGRGTPYIAYGCEFKWATNIDYLLYLVWEDRWVSQLWAYNWQELVSILWGTEEKDTKNLIDTTEQYRFDWRMIEYRWDLVLSTTDNRIFAYWQTFWGKWGVFIHELSWDITGLKTDWRDLIVEYTENSQKYKTSIQDDTPIKNYNTEWEAVYPIVTWNHLLEKEESDLYCSFILPSADTSLEFRWMANHYHFWTFTSSDNYTFSTTASYKMKWCTWDYELKFIEKNGDQYTFRLEGDLPVQTTNDMKITDSEGTELITHSDFNHFRKIWDITTDRYLEWEFRFHNLNNKLELPRSHSLQIMVKGKGTAQYTPELFALDLVANQRERW